MISNLNTLKLMKLNRIFTIFLLLTLFLSCDSPESKLQQTWIGKYRVQDDGAENRGPRVILDFNKDSVLMKVFNIDFPYQGDDLKIKSRLWGLSLK